MFIFISCLGTWFLWATVLEQLIDWKFTGVDLDAKTLFEAILVAHLNNPVLAKAKGIFSLTTPVVESNFLTVLSEYELHSVIKILSNPFLLMRSLKPRIG